VFWQQLIPLPATVARLVGPGFAAGRHEGHQSALPSLVDYLRWKRGDLDGAEPRALTARYVTPLIQQGVDARLCWNGALSASPAADLSGNSGAVCHPDTSPAVCTAGVAQVAGRLKHRKYCSSGAYSYSFHRQREDTVTEYADARTAVLAGL